MNIDREKLMVFAKEYEILTDKKKDITKDIAEYVDGFVGLNEIKKKKPFIDSVKQYIKWQNDKIKVDDELNIFDEFYAILTNE